MELIYNNKKLEIVFSGNIKNLLKEQGIDDTKVAIQLNNKIISRNKWEEYTVNAEDKVTIIEIIAGG